MGQQGGINPAGIERMKERIIKDIDRLNSLSKKLKMSEYELKEKKK